MVHDLRWVRRDTSSVTYFDLSSGRHLAELIQHELVDYPNYVWRGQRCDNWALEPTLARKARDARLTLGRRSVLKHLEEFKFAALGKLGTEPEDENEWWALGQHHGLATPLLDWTSSPFVAAYFAYMEDGPCPTERRAIWGLSRDVVRVCSRKIVSGWRRKGPAPKVDLFRSSFGENARLIRQAGWFTKAPDGMDLESWAQRYADRHVPESVLLLKITLPNSDRKHCLRMLDRMNINHLSLFPDLDGAARYCNTFLEIDRYH